MKGRDGSTLAVGIVCHSGFGGSARAGVDLACELARRGHEVHVFARGVPPALRERPPGLTVRALDPDASASPRLDVDWSETDREALATLVSATVRERRLDVLNWHYALPFAAIVERAWELLGADAPPVVGTLHGTDVSAGTAGVLREALGHVAALTTVSHDHAGLAVELLGLPRAPRVIPNAIDLSRFAPARVRRRPFGRPRILHVSNFRAVKDSVGAARAFVALRRMSDAELWVVGDGDEMPNLRAVLADARLLHDARLLGLRRDVETIYPQVDVVLVTSRRESFSLVALEAAACGVPVVAPRVGGLAENVVDGETGVLYDRGDAAEPAATLARLLADRAARAAMGRAGPAHAREFALPVGAARYEDVYRDVIAARPAPAPASLSVR